MPPPPTIEIRLATEADAAVLAEMMLLFDNVARSAETQAMLMRAASAHERVLLACIADHIVGVSIVRFAPMSSQPTPYAELTDLYVRVEARRMGVGRALLQATEQTAREWGASGLWLITGFTNSAAQALYHAEGMQDWALALRKTW